jgi:flagellar hook-associated protein 2
VGILKLGGLASGLDTENLIKTLMSLEQRPLTGMTKQRDTLTAQASAWRDLNSRLLTLKKRVDELNALTASDFTAKSSSNTDNSVLSVSGVTSSATLGANTVEVVSLANATIWQSGLMSNAGTPKPVADPTAALGVSGTIEVAGNPTAFFAVAATDSLNSIAQTINSKSADLGFTASVVQVNPGDYRLVLKGNNGVANDFTLQDATGSTAAADLMLASGAATKINTAANGQIKVNGVSVTVTDSTVKDAIAGVTLTLNKVGTSTLTVTKDYSKVIGAVQKVVDQYNSVMDLVGQQTSYDSKSKQAGPLFGEDRVRTITDALSSRMFSPVDDTASPLPDLASSLGIIGIATEGFKGAEKGTSRKLTLDTTKLQAALDKDPASVRRLFANTGAGTTASQGIAVRLSTYLDNYTRADGILAGTAKALDKNVELIKGRIDHFQNDLLPMKEQQLRTQFTALEKAMSAFQNQGNWLSTQLKSLSGSSSGN